MADLFIVSIPIDPAYGQSDTERADLDVFTRECASKEADRAGVRLVTRWAWMWLTEPQLRTWIKGDTGYPAHPLYHSGYELRCGFALAEPL